MKSLLITDEALEAVISLEMLCEQLPKVIGNAHYWRWIVIALHNALQGFMVLALKGSDGLNVLTEECEKKWMAAYKRGDKVFPKRKLDSFPRLYEKIKSGRRLYEEEMKTGRMSWRKKTDRMLMYVRSQPFKPEGTQTESVEMLNTLRNKFIHFLPMGLLLDVSGLPQVVKDCVNIIAFLAFECGNVHWHDKGLEIRAKELVENALTQADIVASAYSSLNC